MIYRPNEPQAKKRDVSRETSLFALCSYLVTVGA